MKGKWDINWLVQASEGACNLQLQTLRLLCEGPSYRSCPFLFPCRTSAQQRSIYCCCSTGSSGPMLPQAESAGWVALHTAFIIFGVGDPSYHITLLRDVCLCVFVCSLHISAARRRSTIGAFLLIALYRYMLWTPRDEADWKNRLFAPIPGTKLCSSGYIFVDGGPVMLAF